jgi:glycosyltransferase involved in cell wall biosynthesis
MVELPDACAVFVGDVPPDIDESYRVELETLARELGVAEQVTFAGSLPPEGVRDQFRCASAAVNLSPAGLFDKAALEAMAVGVPTVVASEAFDDVTGGDARLRIPAPDDNAALASCLRELLALPEAERRTLGAKLRERVVAAHSLDGLIARLVSVLNTGEPA